MKQFLSDKNMTTTQISMKRKGKAVTNDLNYLTNLVTFLINEF